MLGEREEALGEIWHIPSADPIASRELLDMIFEEMGQEPKVRVANGVLLSGLAMFNSDMRRLKREKVYQFTTPRIIDHSKYEQAFGIDTAPRSRQTDRGVVQGTPSDLTRTPCTRHSGVRAVWTRAATG